MTTQSPDDWFARLARASHPRREIAQALNCQNIRKRIKIIAQRRIFRYRRREVFHRYFTRPRSERIGADFIKANRLQVFVDRHGWSAGILARLAPHSAQCFWPLLTRGLLTPLPRERFYSENISVSTNSHRICPIKLCVSCMRCVSLLSTISARSQSDFTLPPSRPSKPITMITCSRACSQAATMFGEVPEVEIARQTSPFAPSASIWRANTFSNPVSLAMQVSTPPSVVKAIAGSARRFSRNRLTSSPAICCASAAEPPLPNSRSLPPPLRVAAIISATRSTSSACPSKKRRFVSRLSVTIAEMRSIKIFLPAGSLNRRGLLPVRWLVCSVLNHAG